MIEDLGFWEKTINEYISMQRGEEIKYEKKTVSASENPNCSICDLQDEGKG